MRNALIPIGRALRVPVARFACVNAHVSLLSAQIAWGTGAEIAAKKAAEDAKALVRFIPTCFPNPSSQALDDEGPRRASANPFGTIRHPTRLAFAGCAPQRQGCEGVRGEDARWHPRVRRANPLASLTRDDVAVSGAYRRAASRLGH